MAVRWDAVVQDNQFWAEPGGPVSSMPDADANSPASVEVWLFGTLAEAVVERPVKLQLERPFCVADVIDELGRRHGPQLLARITAPDGVKARNCRVFVNGRPVGDIAAPLRIGAIPTQVELIVLNALEGG